MQRWLSRMRDQAGDRRSAFTLIELLVVIMIIAILASILIFAVTRFMGKGKEAETHALFDAIDKGIVKWRQEEKKANDAYPSSGKNSAKATERHLGAKMLFKALVTDPIAKGKNSYVDGHEKYTGYLNADGSVSMSGNDKDKVFIDGHGQPIVYWEWSSKTKVVPNEDPTAAETVKKTDPNEMKLANRKGSYDLYSCGDDQQFGTKDDLEAGSKEPVPMERNPFKGITTGGSEATGPAPKAAISENAGKGGM